MLEAWELDVLGKVGSVGERLLGRQKAHVLGPQIRHRETGAVVSVLKDNANAARRLGQHREDAVIQKREPVLATGLARGEDDDRATLTIVLSIEPVSQMKRISRMGGVDGFIVEVIDGHRDVDGRRGAFGAERTRRPTVECPEFGVRAVNLASGEGCRKAYN